MYTDYHTKFYAHALTRRSSSDDPDKLGASLMNATVDLNPHQIDAAMFAFRSPLSRGAILADEVGLGKTIEAGLIISQLWAERKRRILIIVPTTLRKQWVEELADKFFLDAEVFDSKRYNSAVKAGSPNPFTDTSKIIICSYNFARFAQEAIATTLWDLVVIDEAHRLRNVLKSGNKIARAIKESIGQAKGKVLLTATPLQNTLLELYALTSFLDEHLFGDLESFKAQYLRGALNDRDFNELRQRIRPICQRTLRRQVQEYVRFTNRIPMVHDFTPSDAEQRLYEEVSEYLRRDELFALPKSQRKLMILVLRKLLASSTFAIAGTLESLRSRVQALHEETAAEEAAVAEDFEGFDEMAEEWSEGTPAPGVPDREPPLDLAAIRAEVNDLIRFRDLATSITENAKGEKLIQALRKGFEKLQELGANAKAVIFTESRRTQQYLWDLLNANGYQGQVMTFNGTNTDSASAQIYKEWTTRHEGEATVSGRKDVDLRAALIEHFRDRVSIMIATEAAAEGVNLQFCSLVVNYDLPWNPQRIEQRIGRCHRYGQRYDVVVINFLNRANEADLRVFQILNEKFRLFDGVFGASDEVLGALESGVDFERRVGEIYQSCRSAADIDAAFNQLQQELGDEIQNRMSATRATLLEHFDEEVHQRLELRLKSMEERLDRFHRWLWQLTRHELRDAARFQDEGHRFFVPDKIPGFPAAPTGSYRLVTRERVTDGFHPYRLGHDLAQHLLGLSRDRALASSLIRFDYSGHSKGRKISDVERLRGKRGWLALTKVAIEALQQEEDYLVFAAVTSDGAAVESEACERLFEVPGDVISSGQIDAAVESRLDNLSETMTRELMARLADRNQRFFVEEIDKLDRWADDRKRGLEQELKIIKTEITALKRTARMQGALEEKVALQRKVKDMEAQLTRKRRELFEAEDEIDRQKEELISNVEARLSQNASLERLFVVEWEVQ